MHRMHIIPPQIGMSVNRASVNGGVVLHPCEEKVYHAVRICDISLIAGGSCLLAVREMLYIPGTRYNFHLERVASRSLCSTFHIN